MSLQWEAQVVGINYYPEYTRLHHLTAAAKDAEEIAAQLSDYGYETFRVQRLPRQPNQKGEWHISSETAVTTKDLERAIANLFNPPDGNIPEVALFFFSGHGWHKTVNGKEEVFLATSDVLPDEGLYGVPLKWLGEQIQISPAKKVVVWLDCCYSGALLNYKPTNKDYCLIGATRSYEPGLEIPHQQGLFTETLEKVLNPDYYPDDIIDSHNLVKFIQKEMAQTAQAPQCAISERSILLTSKVRKKAFQDKCPYRSLNFFTEDEADARVFRGRTKLTQDLVERVRAENRLIAVFGASGSGKSSLIRAGLLYELKLGEKIAGSNNWVHFKPFTPTDDPLAKLAEIEKVGWVDDKQMVMIVDQFEECFTMSDKEKRDAFINALTELMETKPNLYLVIGMRSDFRGRLREYLQFSEKMSKVNVEHLNRDEIREAIEKPAEVVGLGIESSLKQQLINDVEDYPGSLPLLQYTLTELWNETRKQEEAFLRLATYQNLGGIEGTLEKRADEVYQSLSTEEQTVAKRVFLELTQVGDALDTRRRVRLGDLVNYHHSLEILNGVTNKLADENNRLITRDEQNSQDSSNIIIDVVHEALIRHWTRLGEWKKQYQAAMASERKIEGAAQEWDERGRKTDYLLKGLQLGVAEEYLKSYGDLAMLDGMAEEFIEKSINNRSRNRRIRTGTIAGVGGLVALGAIGSIFFGFDAKRQKNIAQIKEQAFNVRSSLTTEKNISPLILAVDTVGDNLKYNSNPFNFHKNLFGEVRSGLIDALDVIRERNILKDHQGVVSSVAISRDGQTIVSGGYDGTVRLWNRNGQPLGQPFKGHRGKVWSVAISPDGQTIVSGGRDRTVRLWDRKGQAIRVPLKGHQGEVLSVAISPDGQTIVSGGDDGTVRLWNRNGQPLGQPLKGHRGKVWSVAISPNGQTIVSGGDDGTVRLWDRRGQAQVIGQPCEGHDDRVYTVAISPDGQTIVSGSFDKVYGTVRLWDMKGQLLGQLFKMYKSAVWSVAISPDGQNIISGDSDGTVRLWDRTGQAIGQPFKGHQGYVSSVAISSNGQTIVSGSNDGTVRLWERKEPSKTLQGHQDYVSSVAISPDGQMIVSGGDDGTVRLWDRNGQAIGQPLREHEGRVFSVAISSLPLPSLTKGGEGGVIVSGSDDGTVRLWDRNGQAIGQPLKGHEGGVSSVAISSNGQTIVSGGDDGTVRLWERKEPSKTLQGHQGYVSSVAISSNGQTIVSGSDDGTVRLWDRNGQAIGQPLKGHEGGVSSVAFSSNGQTIVSGGDDGTVRLWDKNGQAIGQPLKGHEGGVSSVAFSPDGQTIVSGGEDGTVRLWDRKGQAIGQPFKGHEGRISSVAISPDGQTIVSGGRDRTVRLWRGHNWQDWLNVGCDRLRLHPVFLSPAADDATEQDKKTVQEAVSTCLNNKVWTDPEKAEFFVRQGLALAREKGELTGAKQKFHQAHQLDPTTIDLAKLEAESKRLIASFFVSKGLALAQEKGDLEGAKQKFKQAYQLKPETTNLEDLEVKIKKYAPDLIEKGQSQAKEGKIPQALTLYENAQKLDPSFKIDAVAWNQLCWFGSLNGYAKNILFACDKAVRLASDEDRASWQDSRGVARALTGDKQGASADFEVYVSSPYPSEEYKAKRRQWIEALKAGKNPFTDQVLQELKNE